MSGAAIGRALPSDAARLAHIHRAARAAAMPWLAVVHTPAEDLAYFETHVLVQSDVWVARGEDGPEAFIARRAGWIDHLYVSPEAFGSGLGSLLIDRAKSGQFRLQLWTFERSTRARTFYLRHGFVAVEHTDGAGNEEREPDVRYLWETTP